MAFAGALLAPAASFAQVSCTRDGLKAATDLYIAAQTKGDISGLPLAKGLGYVENFKTMNIDEGLIKTAMKIDHHRSLLDTSTCQTFTEVIVSDKANPYVLGTRLRVNHGLIAEIEMMWTTTGYWVFNADNYLKYSSSEDWGVIPAAKRDTRATWRPPLTLIWMRSWKGKWTWFRGVSLATARKAVCTPEGSSG